MKWRRNRGRGGGELDQVQDSEREPSRDARHRANSEPCCFLSGGRGKYLFRAVAHRAFLMARVDRYNKKMIAELFGPHQTPHHTLRRW